MGEPCRSHDSRRGKPAVWSLAQRWTDYLKCWTGSLPLAFVSCPVAAPAPSADRLALPFARRTCSSGHICMAAACPPIDRHREPAVTGSNEFFQKKKNRRDVTAANRLRSLVALEECWPKPWQHLSGGRGGFGSLRRDGRPAGESWPRYFGADKPLTARIHRRS